MEIDEKEKLAKRRLLTIFAADVAGYSRLVSEDERSALNQLELLRASMDAIISQNDGIIANTAGDSVVAYFHGPVNAVQASMLIQAAQEEHNHDVPKEKQVQVRIGINIGDVAVQPNGDLLGNGVNVAARLEAIAQPGGICLAENVFDQVQHVIEQEFTKIGEHFVKNIEKPIVVYSNDNSGTGHLARFTRLAQVKSRTTSFQYVVFTSVLVALTLSIWLTISRKDTPYNSGWDVQSVLSSDPSPTELLDHFDLVTDGIFEGSRYFVIRTWGIELVGLQQIARVLGGHLVAIGSEEENSFVFDLTLKDEGHWQFVDGNAVGPMIGLLQDSSGKEPDQGWAWANGEPVTYTNWKPHSPDNYGGNQDFANFLGRRTTSPDSRWNDMNGPNHSFIVEVPLKSPN